MSLVAGCGAAACPRQPITDPSQALAAHQDRAIQSLRAEARVDQRGKSGRIKGTVLMFVERPDRVRFDAMTQFGPALVLTSDGETFAFSDFKSRRYLTGLACPQNIARLVGVPLPVPAVVSALMGEAPELSAARATISCSDRGQYVVERTAADGMKQVILLDVLAQDRKKLPEEQRTQLAAVTLWDGSGRKLYRIAYEDYQKVQGHSLPFTVRVEDFVADADALVRFKSIDVNVAVPADAFAQTPRPGLQQEEALCE